MITINLALLLFSGKPKTNVKAPKIQRLITPVIERRRKVIKLKARKRAENSKQARIEYAQLLAKRMRELAKKRLSSRSSVSSRKGRKKSVSSQS